MDNESNDNESNDNEVSVLLLNNGAKLQMTNTVRDALDWELMFPDKPVSEHSGTVTFGVFISWNNGRRNGVPECQCSWEQFLDKFEDIIQVDGGDPLSGTA